VIDFFFASQKLLIIHYRFIQKFINSLTIFAEREISEFILILGNS